MKKWGIMASCQRENGLLLCWGLSLDLSFLGPSCKRQTIQQSRGPGFFIFFFFTLVACVATRNEELGLFHAWLGPASITKNNGELPCLLASSSQVHGRGAWFFQFFFFPWATVRVKFLTCVCCSWNESGSGGLFFFFFFDLQCPPFLLSYTFILDFGVKTDRIMLDTWIKQQKGGKNYSTQYSRLVSYGSTDWASTCLPTQIGRDGGLSGVYGRSW